MANKEEKRIAELENAIRDINEQLIASEGINVLRFYNTNIEQEVVNVIRSVIGGSD